MKLLITLVPLFLFLSCAGTTSMRQTYYYRESPPEITDAVEPNAITDSLETDDFALVCTFRGVHYNSLAFEINFENYNDEPVHISPQNFFLIKYNETDSGYCDTFSCFPLARSAVVNPAEVEIQAEKERYRKRASRRDGWRLFGDLLTITSDVIEDVNDTSSSYCEQYHKELYREKRDKELEEDRARWDAELKEKHQQKMAQLNADKVEFEGKLLPKSALHHGELLNGLIYFPIEPERTYNTLKFRTKKGAVYTIHHTYRYAPPQMLLQEKGLQ